MDGHRRRRGHSPHRQRTLRDPAAGGADADTPPAVPAVPPQPALPQADAPDSPRSQSEPSQSGAPTHVDIDMAKLLRADPADDDDDDHLTLTPSSHGGETSAHEMLQRAAVRAYERSAEQAAGGGKGAAPKAGRRPPAEDEDDMDYVVGANGQFKLVSRGERERQARERAARVQRHLDEEGKGQGADGGKPPSRTASGCLASNKRIVFADKVADDGGGGSLHGDIGERKHATFGGQDRNVHYAAEAAPAPRTREPPPHQGSGRWSGLRRACARLTRHWLFQGVVLLFIGLSTYLLATEYPIRPANVELNDACELAVLVFFTVEFLLMIVGHGRSYFSSYWNLLDALVVVIGWTAMVVETLAPESFAQTLKVLRMMRILRPLRAFAIIPSLRSIANATIFALKDLGSTLLIVLFFLCLFGILLNSILSAVLRFRCYDTEARLFDEPRSLICTPFDDGRQCPNPNATCVDSAGGEHANGTTGGRGAELVPYYLGPSAVPQPIHANPPHTPSFDNFLWSTLNVFTVWGGVGWVDIMYYVADSQGRGWELVFMCIQVRARGWVHGQVPARMGLPA